jgi:hypothetical protein
MALGVEAHDLGSRIVEDPQLAVRGDVKKVHRGRLRKRPLVEGLAVLVEYLHAAVAAIAQGKERLGPNCGTGVCGGCFTTGSSPRSTTNRRFGLLAKTPSTAPSPSSRGRRVATSAWANPAPRPKGRSDPIRLYCRGPRRNRRPAALEHGRLRGASHHGSRDEIITAAARRISLRSMNLVPDNR